MRPGVHRLVLSWKSPHNSPLPESLMDSFLQNPLPSSEAPGDLTHLSPVLHLGAVKECTPQVSPAHTTLIQIPGASATNGSVLGTMQVRPVLHGTGLSDSPPHC